VISEVAARPEPTFKPTEIGSIPSDWDVLPLERIAQLERGKFSARPRNDPKYFGGSIPFIQTGDVRNSGGLITSYSQNLNNAGLKVSKLFPAGTLFITIAANIGDLGFATFATACPDSLVAIRPRKATDYQWLYFALSSRKTSFESIATQNAQLNLNLEKLRPYLIAVPSTAEQTHIADALNDVDGLIRALERLLSKKQAIKQGMMQQLLTGKTRLPGFNEPWRATTFGRLGTFLKGRGVKRDDVRASGVACIRYGELYTAFDDYTSVVRSFVSPEVAATALPLRSGDLLFAASGETREEIGMCVSYVGPEPAIAGGDIVVLRGSEFNSIYVALLANTPEVVNQKSRAGQGDAVVHISSGALAAIEVALPAREEQDAIASVVVDSDKEIQSLETRLRKAKAIKQGMMQQLLTGRTRLPVEEIAA